MQCPSCDAAVREGAKFCGKCDTALPRGCPACGHVNPIDDRFCAECLTLSPDYQDALALLASTRTCRTSQPRAQRLGSISHVSNNGGGHPWLIELAPSRRRN
jgi:hypothetical protein